MTWVCENCGRAVYGSEHCPACPESVAGVCVDDPPTDAMVEGRHARATCGPFRFECSCGGRWTSEADLELHLRCAALPVAGVRVPDEPTDDEAVERVATALWPEAMAMDSRVEGWRIRQERHREEARVALAAARSSVCVDETPTRGVLDDREAAVAERFEIALVPASTIKVGDLILSGSGVTRVVEAREATGPGVALSLLNGDKQYHLGTGLVWQAVEWADRGVRVPDERKD